MNKRNAMKFIKNYETVNEYNFEKDFKEIVLRQVENYEEPKGFFEDLQHGGCISGMISEFVYHADCKKFYVDYIDDLEDFKKDMEDGIGEITPNRHNLPHYTFMCWLCFEEYCYQLYSEIYEN